jgi:hypothetical protein
MYFQDERGKLARKLDPSNGSRWAQHPVEYEENDISQIWLRMEGQIDQLGFGQDGLAVRLRLLVTIEERILQ